MVELIEERVLVKFIRLRALSCTTKSYQVYAGIVPTAASLNKLAVFLCIGAQLTTDVITNLHFVFYIYNY